MNELLFSYGTLQLETVQLDTFGRKLAGVRDAILGFVLSSIEIKDDKTVALSGQKIHSIAIATGNHADFVEGVVFEITAAELLKADAYEVSDYERKLVDLKSGGKAWVYLKRDQQAAS